MPVPQTRNTHLRNSNRSVDSCMRPRSFDSSIHQYPQALAVQGGAERAEAPALPPACREGGPSESRWVGTAGAMAEWAGRNQLSATRQISPCFSSGSHPPA